jgi:hypothetical protein
MIPMILPVSFVPAKYAADFKKDLLQVTQMPGFVAALKA